MAVATRGRGDPAKKLSSFGRRNEAQAELHTPLITRESGNPDSECELLPERRDDGPQTHLLGKAIRGLHLLVVELFNERPRGKCQATDRGAVEHDRHHAVTDAVHQAAILVA